MASIKLLIMLLCMIIGYNWAFMVNQRVKRQNVAFSQSSYSFSPTSCVPGVIVGTTSAPGTTYYTIAFPNQYIGVNSNTGQVLLINYLALNVPQTATIRSYVGPGFSGTSATTTVTVTCVAGSSGNGNGSGGTATGVPVASQVPFVITAGTCNFGNTIGQVTVTNPAQVVFGSATSGTAFLVSNTGVISLSQAISPGTYTILVTATNPYGTSTIPVTINAGCTGGSGGSGTSAPQFFSNSYNFSPTGSSCTTGATIGSVAVTSSSGSPSYTISPTNSAFAISSNGAITLTGSPLPTSRTQYTFSVLATNNFGSAIVPVSVSAGTCSASGGSSGGIQFNQASYSYQFLSGCTAFGVIGQVTATTTPAATVTYSLPVGTTNNFGIDPSSGMIYATVANGQCNILNVTARNAAGQTSTVPVYIDCTIGGSASCAAGGFNIPTTTCVPGSFSCGDIG